MATVPTAQSARIQMLPRRWHLNKFSINSHTAVRHKIVNDIGLSLYIIAEGGLVELSSRSFVDVDGYSEQRIQNH